MITNGTKTYAVYTYHCGDIQWSEGSVIGFNAGGSYYVNHPLSDSIEARDIDCVHHPESEWNNVVYDVNPNGTIPIIPQTVTGYAVCVCAMCVCMFACVCVCVCVCVASYATNIRFPFKLIVCHHRCLFFFYSGFLPFLPLSTTPGVTTLLVPNLDDGSSSPVHVPTGFPIGNSNQSLVFVSRVLP